jgi:hypothetical protein
VEPFGTSTNPVTTPTNTVSLRKSSIGQLDVSLGSEFAEVDENSLKVVSILTLGAFQSTLSFLPSKIHDRTRPNIGIHVSATERYAQCTAMETTEASSQSNWLLPPPTESQNTFQNASSLDVTTIIQQFLCISYSMHQFYGELEVARQLILEQELEANEAGPRSIQEVRRARQKVLDAQAELEVKIPDELQTEIMKITKSFQSLHEIAKAEQRHHSLGVALLWVCRWQEKIRWGLQFVSHIHPRHRRFQTSTNISKTIIDGNKPSSSNAPNSMSSSSSSSTAVLNFSYDNQMNISKSLFNSILVGVKHTGQSIINNNLATGQISFSSSTSSSSSSELLTATSSKSYSDIFQQSSIQVQVTIRSIVSRDLLVSLKLIDDLLDDSLAPMRQLKAEGWLRGHCLWQGKISYEDLLLSANESMQLSFELCCLTKGVFDVNR